MKNTLDTSFSQFKKKYQKMHKKQKYSLIAGIITLAIFSVLAISALFLQKSLREESFDTRRAAYVEGGIVTISSNPAPNTNFLINQEASIDILLNTNSLNINGVELRFDINNANINEYTQINAASIPGLTNVQASLVDSGTVEFLSITDLNSVTAGFNTSQETAVLRISFIPRQVGTFEFVFDNDNSYATSFGSAPADQLSRPGNMVFHVVEELATPQCEYAYSEWSDCIDGWQTRDHVIQPTGCEFHEPRILQETVRYCGDIDLSDLDFLIYSYETCWNSSSSGESIYFIWDNDAFSNVSWIDISPNVDFSELAHKNVQDHAYSNYENFIITDGTGFVWSDGSVFRFEPATTYYVRFYNGSHSPVLAFQMPRCAGQGGTATLYCNQACDSSEQCVGDLVCNAGRCRNPYNLTSEICVYPPDAGLNRSCNEYCANDSECSSGYTCWWNRCRNPENLESESCSNPVSRTTYYTTYTRYIAAGADPDVVQCNEYCTTNRDCESNHRCYYNQCRLATNPNNPECTTASPPAKGELIAEEELEATPTTEVTISPTVETATPTQYHQTIDTGIEEGSKPLEEQTAFDALKEYLSAQGIPVFWLIVAGLSLLAIIVLFIILMLRRRDEEEEDHIQNLEHQVPPSTMSQRSSLTKPQTKMPPIPGTGQTKPQVGQTSSMMNKVKQKGIQPPKQN